MISVTRDQAGTLHRVGLAGGAVGVRRDPLVTAADCDADGVIHLDMPGRQHRAITKARFAGQRVDVEVRLRKSKRSLQANAAFHAEAFNYARWKGHAAPADAVFVEAFKDDLLGLLS